MTRLALLSLLLLAAARAEEAAASEDGYSSEYSGAGEGDKSGEGGGADGTSGKTRKELASQYEYCKSDDCYELLGVTKESKLPAIKKVYRKLAAEYHPDKCASGDVEVCKEKFPKYANAYEILTNSEMRANYDYVMDNPHEFPGFWIKYPRFKFAPQSDLRLVLLMTILGFGGVQYYIKKARYEQDIESLKRDPRSRYQERLKEVLAKSGSSSPSKSAKHNKTGGKDKSDELEKKKKEAMALLDAEIAEELPPPPSIADNIAVDVFKLPVTTLGLVLWVVSGGMSAPDYKTRKALGMSASEWADLGEESQKEFLEMELWVADNLAAYEEEERRAAAAGEKTGKQKREARQRKREKRNPSAPDLGD